jgi:hypothetical protein
MSIKDFLLKLIKNPNPFSNTNKKMMLILATLFMVFAMQLGLKGAIFLAAILISFYLYKVYKS